MRYPVLVIALIGALTPFAAGGQQAAPPPLDILLTNREALALTPAQVARLDSIKAGLRARNEPLISRVLELRAELRREQRAVNRAAGGRQGQAIRQSPMQGQAQPRVARIEQIRGEIQSLMREIDGNNRAAMQQQVNPTLTPRQKQRLQQMLRELIPPRRPPGQGASGAQGGAAGTLPPPALGG
jgi:hypothetical protein